MSFSWSQTPDFGHDNLAASLYEALQPMIRGLNLVKVGDGGEILQDFGFTLRHKTSTVPHYLMNAMMSHLHRQIYGRNDGRNSNWAYKNRADQAWAELDSIFRKHEGNTADFAADPNTKRWDNIATESSGCEEAAQEILGAFKLVYRAIYDKEWKYEEQDFTPNNISNAEAESKRGMEDTIARLKGKPTANKPHQPKVINDGSGNKPATPITATPPKKAETPTVNDSKVDDNAPWDKPEKPVEVQTKTTPEPAPEVKALQSTEPPKPFGQTGDYQTLKEIQRAEGEKRAAEERAKARPLDVLLTLPRKDLTKVEIKIISAYTKREGELNQLANILVRKNTGRTVHKGEQKLLDQMNDEEKIEVEKRCEEKLRKQAAKNEIDTSKVHAVEVGTATPIPADVVEVKEIIEQLPVETPKMDRKSRLAAIIAAGDIKSDKDKVEDMLIDMGLKSERLVTRLKAQALSGQALRTAERDLALELMDLQTEVEDKMQKEGLNKNEDLVNLFEGRCDSILNAAFPKQDMPEVRVG